MRVYLSSVYACPYYMYTRFLCLSDSEPSPSLHLALMYPLPAYVNGDSTTRSLIVEFVQILKISFRSMSLSRFWRYPSDQWSTETGTLSIDASALIVHTQPDTALPFIFYSSVFHAQSMIYCLEAPFYDFSLRRFYIFFCCIVHFSIFRKCSIILK